MIALFLTDTWIALWIASLVFVGKLAYEYGRNQRATRGRQVYDHARDPLSTKHTTHHWR